VCVVCVSDLPAGSGMGGSSILAAAVLRCLGDLLGLNSSQEDLVYQVSQVEQILTAGGGWQDQVRMSAVVSTPLPWVTCMFYPGRCNLRRL
jgi:galactokinase/mevalonate kinase-like predicted kinase